MSQSCDSLLRLMKWYDARCDGEWEHSFGIKIETLDNPGWSIEVDLSGSGLEDRAFERLERGVGDDNHDDEGCETGPWMVCWVADQRYHAACGPAQLREALTVFLDWAGVP
ncbi:MAG: immunity 53 family protein [Phycisphaerales bacterium JB039]